MSLRFIYLKTGKELQVLHGHSMAVYCSALSHNGEILASGSYDTTTVLWNMDCYKQLLVLRGEGGYVNALDFSSDDQRLFTGSNDGKDIFVIALCTPISPIVLKLKIVWTLVVGGY